MNGAELMLRTLADCGVEACFANPGTSEMQLVAAFDGEQRVRSVLCLFEGVAAGAADGYARIAGKPAATLLHLGPGLANAGANLHNARRANAPIVNIVGDHALSHQPLDAPLQSDILSLARPHSTWVKSAASADDLGALAAEAVAASYGPPGGVATLIVPADCAWSQTTDAMPPAALPLHRYGVRVDGRTIEAVAGAVRSARRPVILLGGPACDERALAAAGRLAAGGCRVMVDTFTARLPRGAGRFAPDRVAYFSEMALADHAGADLMVLVGTKAPVAFFAYPAMPGSLVPTECAVQTLSAPHEDGAGALEALADALSFKKAAAAPAFQMPDRPTGDLNAYTLGASIARWAPEGAVLCDEAITGGLPIFVQTRNAQPHDWLSLTGGAIGMGLPLAVGAAIAAPRRKVIALCGDGSAAYTLQALWTMAREGLDVVVVILANHAYRILDIEMTRTGAGAAGRGAAAARLLDLGDPRIDWTALAKGFGCSAVRASDAESFDAAIARALVEPGPHLIEAALAG